MSTNTVVDTTVAYVHDAAVNAASASVIALNQTEVFAISGAKAAVTVNSGGTGLSMAGSFALATVGGYTGGFIDNGALTLSGALAVQATTSDEILSLGVSGSNANSQQGAGTGGLTVALAGQVAVNLIGTTTYAFVSDGSTVSAGSVSVNALDADTIDAVAGAKAKGGDAGVGSSFAVNSIPFALGQKHQILAFVQNSDVAATGALEVGAKSHESIQAVTAALGMANKGMAAAGSVSLNTITPDTEAFVVGQKAAGVRTAGVEVTAGDDAFIGALAGSLGLAKGGDVGFGLAFSLNTIAGGVVRAVINGATIRSGGAVEEKAASSPTITVFAGAGGAAKPSPTNSGGSPNPNAGPAVGAGAAAALNAISVSVSATVGDQSAASVNAAGLTLEADADATIGVLALGGGGAIDSTQTGGGVSLAGGGAGGQRHQRHRPRGRPQRQFCHHDGDGLADRDRRLEDHRGRRRLRPGLGQGDDRRDLRVGRRGPSPPTSSRTPCRRCRPLDRQRRRRRRFDRHLDRVHPGADRRGVGLGQHGPGRQRHRLRRGRGRVGQRRPRQDARPRPELRGRHRRRLGRPDGGGRRDHHRQRRRASVAAGLGQNGATGGAVGAAAAINVIADTIQANVDASSVKAAGDVRLTATADETVFVLAVGVAGSLAAGGTAGGVSLAGAGSGSGNAITNTVQAGVLDGALVTAVGTLTLSADDASKIDAAAGSMALAAATGQAGGTALGVGVSVAANLIADTRPAPLVDKSQASGDAGVDLEAADTATIRALNVAGSAAGGVGQNGGGAAFAGAGAGSINTVTNAVSASVTGGQQAAAENGPMTLHAEDDATIDAVSGGARAGHRGRPGRGHVRQRRGGGGRQCHHRHHDGLHRRLDRDRRRRHLALNAGSASTIFVLTVGARRRDRRESGRRRVAGRGRLRLGQRDP